MRFERQVLVLSCAHGLVSIASAPARLFSAAAVVQFCGITLLWRTPDTGVHICGCRRVFGGAHAFRLILVTGVS